MNLNHCSPYLCCPYHCHLFRYLSLFSSTPVTIARPSSSVYVSNFHCWCSCFHSSHCCLPRRLQAARAMHAASGSGSHGLQMTHPSEQLWAAPHQPLSRSIYMLMAPRSALTREYVHAKRPQAMGDVVICVPQASTSALLPVQLARCWQFRRDVIMWPFRLEWLCHGHRPQPTLQPRPGLLTDKGWHAPL